MIPKSISMFLGASGGDTIPIISYANCFILRKKRTGFGE